MRFLNFRNKKNVYKRLLQLWLDLYIKFAQILSVDTKNLDGARGSAPDPARGAHDAPHRPPSRTQTSRISEIKIIMVTLWKLHVSIRQSIDQTVQSGHYKLQTCNVQQIYNSTLSFLTYLIYLLTNLLYFFIVTEILLI